MLTQQDLQQIAQKGISEAQIQQQLNEFKTGFPFLRLKAAASIEDGIVAPSEQDKQAYIQAWNDYKQQGHKIVKFVPASGAASRMFKDMFAFVDADYDVPTTRSLPSTTPLTPPAARTRASRLTTSSRTDSIRRWSRTCSSRKA